jgi:hypothetical protein
VTVPELGTPGLVGSGEHAPPTADRRDRIRAVLADLFPEPTGQAPRAGLARWAFFLLQVVVVALGAAVMLARIGGRPAWESVYAEDTGIYLPAALAHPWHLLQSYGGYLQLVPRVIGQAAALVPIRHASAVFAVGGALVAAACGLFAYHASAGQVGSRWLRALIGLSVVLLPVAQLEIADNGVNSIWYLLAALFWAALWRPRTRAGLAAAAVVGFAAAASSSLGLLFAPLFAARLLVLPRRPGEQAATIGWAAGCLLQVAIILTSHVSRLTPHNPLNAVLYYSREVLLPALGWHLSWDLRHAVGVTLASVIMGVLILGVLAWVVVTQPGRCRVFVLTAVATGLLFSAFTSAFAWGGPTQRVMVTVEHGARYSTVPILLLDAALIVAADAYARRWWPHRKAIAAVTVLVAVLAAGWATDFRYPVRRFAGISSSWAHRADRWLSHCRHRPDGTITVSFHDWWGTVPLSSTFRCTSLHR